jgi:hypothetical protein
MHRDRTGRCFLRSKFDSYSLCIRYVFDRLDRIYSTNKSFTVRLLLQSISTKGLMNYY